MRLDFETGAFDLSANAAAPLQAWAPEIQARARFEDGGQGPERFDCMGLALFVQRLIGRPARDYADLYRGLDVADHDAVGKLIAAEAVIWEDAPGEPGDVLVLGTGRRAHHVAVLCGAGRALHALSGAGVKIEEIEGRRQVRRFAHMRLYGVGRPSL